jgi:adenylate cyclase
MIFVTGEHELKHVSADQNARALAAIEPHQVSIVRQLDGKGEIKIAMPQASGLLINIPRLQTAAKYTGHIVISPDRDGSLRWASLVIPYASRYFPSGDVQAVRAFTGGTSLVLNTMEDGIIGLEVAGRVADTNELGRALIRYYGPEQTFTTFSAADVLGANFDSNLVKDRIVLLGATAKGIGDIRVTPYSPAFPGVEVRATVMQNLLNGDFIRRPGWMQVTDMLLLVVLGAGLSFALPRLRLGAAAGAIVVMIGVYIGIGFYLFEYQRVWLTLSYPVLLMVLLFVSNTLVQYFLTDTERRRIKSAMQYYVPTEVVEEITKNIEALKLGGEKRELTVLFSDIRGFTSMAETLSPEDLVRLLNVYLTRMTDQVFRHQGTLDKYIGDAVMAVYGAPIQRADHAVLACHTALDMMKELRNLQEQWRAQQQPVMDIGIGLNTGQMIVGNIGSENRFNYSVIGDAVNLGSRIESLNKTYGTHILISEYTYAQVKEIFSKQLREVDVTLVKGRGQQVRVYELIPDGQYADLDWLADYRRAYRQLRTGEVVTAMTTFQRLADTFNDPVSRYHVRNSHQK